MAPFLYRCPTTGLKVQGWLADDPSGDNDEVYETVTCLACTRIHLINRSTGKVHAATAHQHRDATLDAGAKALALLELRRPFIGLALRRFGAATLRNANRLDGAAHAGRHVLLAEEAAIGAIKVRRTAEGAAMEPERRRHVNFVGRVSLQHLILGNQAFGAFGEKYLVTEFRWRAHLATLDQIGMGLEDRIDLLGRGHLFAIEHAAARLRDHPRAEIAIMRDLIAQGLDLQSGQRVLGAHRGGVVKRLPGLSVDAAVSCGCGIATMTEIRTKCGCAP